MTKMKIIGHRGARGLAPENTIASIKTALRHGADEVEVDLRATKDGQVVLCHDKYVRGPDGRKLRINQTTYKELKAHKPDLATLEEALDAVDGKRPLYLDVKHRVDVKPIVKVLEQRFKHGLPKTQVKLGSFSQKTLRQLHEALPDVQKVVIEHWSGVRAARRARQVNAAAIALNQKWLWFGYIKAASRRYQLYAYTLDDPAKARRWAKSGLAGAITDYPDRFEDL